MVGARMIPSEAAQAVEAHVAKWQKELPDTDMLSVEQHGQMLNAHRVLARAALTKCESFLIQTLSRKASKKTKGRLANYTAQFSEELRGLKVEEKQWQELVHPAIRKLVLAGLDTA